MNNIMKKKAFLKKYGNLEVKQTAISNNEIIYVDDNNEDFNIFVFITGDIHNPNTNNIDRSPYPLEYIVNIFANFNIDIHVYLLHPPPYITCKINAKQ